MRSSRTRWPAAGRAAGRARAGRHRGLVGGGDRGGARRGRGHRQVALRPRPGPAGWCCSASCGTRTRRRPSHRGPAAEGRRRGDMPTTGGPAPPTEHPDLGHARRPARRRRWTPPTAARVRAHGPAPAVRGHAGGLDAVRVDLRACSTPKIPAAGGRPGWRRARPMRARAGDPRTGPGDLRPVPRDPHTGPATRGRRCPRTRRRAAAGEPRTDPSAGRAPEELARRRAVSATDELAVARDRRRRRLTRPGPRPRRRGRPRLGDGDRARW